MAPQTPFRLFALKRPSTLAFTLSALAVVLMVGCMPLPRRKTTRRTSGGLPAWAINLPAPKVDHDADIDSQVVKLTEQLKKLDLSPGFIPPEQIAVLACKELDNDHPWDAALLLAIGTYRHLQVAFYAQDRGLGKLKSRWRRINKSAYRKLVRKEFKLYADLDYSDLGVKVGDLAGGKIKKQQALLDLIRGADDSKGEEDRKAHRKAALDRLSKIAKEHEENVRFKALEEAFLARVKADLKVKKIHQGTIHVISKVPLRDFLLVGLDGAFSAFHADLCRALSRYRFRLAKDIKDRLSSPSSHTRSNAAISLGMAGIKKDAEALESALAGEQDPYVRASILYALIRLGKREHINDLYSGIGQGAPLLRQHATLRVQWLHSETKATLDENDFVQILRDSKNTEKHRLFALYILRDITRQRPLDQAAVDAMFKAVNNRAKRIADGSAEIIGKLKQLDREAVLALLETKITTNQRCALLKRFASHVQASDLKTLTDMFDGTSILRIRRAIASAMGQVDDPAALEHLFTWFRKHKDLRRAIAVAFLSRPEAETGKIVEFCRDYAGTGPGVFFPMVKGDEAILPHVATLLHEGDVNDRLWISRIAGIAKIKSVIPELRKLASYRSNRYYPSDALLRHNASTALINMAYQRAVERVKKEIKADRKP